MRKVFFVIYIVIAGRNLHVIHGTYIQIAGSPAGQNWCCDKQENGKHKSYADKRHGLTGGIQL